MDTPSPHRPPESDPHTCTHQFGMGSLECDVCGNTILTVHHDHERAGQR
jgi:hypothetical protein